MPRGKKLVIVNPLKEQAPLDHRDKLSGERIALHWEGIGPRNGARQAWVSLIRMECSGFARAETVACGSQGIRGSGAGRAGG